MAITVAAAFDTFDGMVTPGTIQWQKYEQRKDAVVTTLKSAFPETSGVRFRSAKIIGSLGRSTGSLPVNDIDLMVYLSVDPDLWRRKYVRDSSKFLYRVRSSLNSKSTVKKIGARGQAVRLFYGDGLVVDVAAMEKYDDGSYAIPDGHGNWLTTNPIKHETYLDECDAALAGDLRMIIRFVKQWNRSHSARLRSFHLEMMVARTFGTLGTNPRTALRLFFEYNHNNLSVPDPAGYSGDLSSYLDCMSRRDVNISLRVALKKIDAALEAERTGKHAEAIRLWRVVLGDKFPTYG